MACRRKSSAANVATGINSVEQTVFVYMHVYMHVCMGGVPGGSVVEKSPANAGDTGDTGSIPGSGRSPGEGNGNPLQCSCLGNPMDRGAWWATGHWVTQSQTCLSTHACPVNSHSKQRLLDRLSDDKVIQARGPPGCQAQEISLNSGPLCTSQRAPQDTSCYWWPARQH